MLSDLIASDALVFFTGAGISRGLKRKNDPAKNLPGWIDLVKELYLRFKVRLSLDVQKDIDDLLDVSDVNKPPRSQDLILAASLCRGGPNSLHGRDFDDEYRQMCTPIPGKTGPVHEEIAKLSPRGIVTFNYDDAHEVAWSLVAHDAFTPWQEKTMTDLLRGRCDSPFILKAHGSISSTEPLVLTAEAYRELMVKLPTYRAFLQNIFANFHFVFVGFGMDDPDYDLWIETFAMQFGAPINEHVRILPENERSRADIMHRRMYGIRQLYYDANQHGQIPEILQQASNQAGPKLANLIENCISPQLYVRHQAHLEMQKLGTCGKSLISRVMTDKARNILNQGSMAQTPSFELSEYAYTLGTIDAMGNKTLLMEIVEKARTVEPVARCLTVLRSVLQMADLPLMQGWLQRFSRTTLSGDRPQRIEEYLKYLILYVENKYKSDP